MGEMMFQFVEICSYWDRAMTCERTLAGLEPARREGKTLGKREVVSETMTAKIQEFRIGNKSILEIASDVGVDRGTSELSADRPTTRLFPSYC